MIIDERTEFADADTLTTTTGTNNEGDVVDLEVSGRDIGQSDHLFVVFQVTTAVTSAGAATVQFKVVSDSTATPATDGTATEHASTEAIGKATLVAGYTRVLRISPVDAERYLGVQAVVGTAALTAGAINAFVTHDPYGWKSYADADNAN